MFKSYKSGQRNTTRIFYKKLKDAQSITEMLAWARRNYPEAARKEEE